MKVFNILLIGIIMSTASCDQENTGPRAPAAGSYGSGGWSIPYDQVYDGGPGKDGIPALENPLMITADEATTLSDDELVVGVVLDGQARAYSHQVLDWHEIINDQIGQHPFALTYCPLTGTAINWSRTIGGKTTTFGVSGLLYNSNLIPYDRNTNSNWSQMLNQSVEGSLIGWSAELLPALETTWGTWKKMFPDTKIISTNTGFDRSYGSYPYTAPGDFDYREEPFLIFPVAHEDDRLHRKERVLGVQERGIVQVYRFTDLSGAIGVFKDQLGAKEIVVAGSSDLNFLTVFQASLHDGTSLDFTALSEDNLPVIMKDQLGNSWDVFGNAVSGPNSGEQLSKPKSYIGYWFAWVAFNAEVEIIKF